MRQILSNDFLEVKEVEQREADKVDALEYELNQSAKLFREVFK